ncbi:HEPN domain-containing protein [Streptomyces kronopolitis]|uniref:ApeA N-terminal domain 1-containing protein n=1 Tax=Streptomyces kronopolitis TaxID=1612435 RepID=UPI00344A2912
MTERQWRGEWWIPGESEKSCSGTLHYAENGRLRLELIDGFDITIREPLPDGNGYSIKCETREVPIIHGTCNNEKFTLLDNNATHTSGPGIFEGSIAKQDWTSSRSLRGVHLKDLSEQIFIRAHLQLERLLHWSSRSTFKLERTTEEGKSPRDLKVSTQAVEPLIAIHNGVTISLRLRSTPFGYKHGTISNRRTLEAREWATLTINSSTAVAFNEFDEIEKDLQDLLTLSAYEPCGVLKRSIVFETSEAHPGSERHANEVDVMGRQVYRTEAASAGPHSRDLIFSLADMEFSDLIPRWIDLKSKARMGCNILFGLRYIERGYVGTRLLGVATAAESIHRSLRSASTPLTGAEYERIKQNLMSAVVGEPQEIQDFVKKGLRNNPTYNERLLELASIPSSDAVDTLLGDKDEWAKKLKNARNNLAHANERSQESDPSPAYLLLEVTYALICLVLMTELGVSSEAQKRAVQNERISGVSRQFKSTLNVGEA